MKKLLISLMVLSMIFVMLPITVSAAFDQTYTAKYGTPVIDGEAEELWDGVEWTSIDKPHDGEDSSDSKVKVKLLWDEEHLYFLAEIIDTNLNIANDIFEVYLDQKHDKTAIYGPDDSQTRFRLFGGVVTGEQSGTNAQTNARYNVTVLGQNMFLMEGCLSWVDAVPAVGKTMGLEFMYNDGTSEKAFVEAYRWNADTANGDPAPFTSTAAFGTLIFADAQGSTEGEYEKAKKEFEKNHTALLADLKALENYDAANDITAENIETVRAMITSVESAIAALEGMDAEIVKEFTAGLLAAKSAVADYEAVLQAKADAIAANQRLYDSIKALPELTANITDETYESVKEAVITAQAGWGNLNREVKDYFTEDGLMDILVAAKAAVTAFVPQENSGNTEDPGQTEDPATGCRSVLSVGAATLLLLAGAWMAYSTRKREV